MIAKQNKNKTKKTTGAKGYGRVVFNQPVPGMLQVPLIFTEPTFVYGNSLGSVWSVRYRMNSAYDPDPATGGGATGFFTEYAALFKRYRVLKFDYDVEVVNNHDSVVVAIVCPTKDDEGANFSGMLNLTENPYAKSHMLASAGGMNRCRFQGTIDLAKFLGYPGYKFDDVTSALVNGNPSISCFFNVGIAAISTTGTPYGVRIKLTYHTEFYEREASNVS